MKLSKNATPGVWGIELLLTFLISPFFIHPTTGLSETVKTDHPRSPLPDAAGQRAALKTVDDVYADEFKKAKGPDQRSALARKLLAAGIDTQNDPAEKYILLKKSVELAVQAGDFATARTASRALGAAYEIDSIKATADLLASMAKSARTPKQQLEYVDNAESIIDDALAANQYDIAKQSAVVAVAAARRSERIDRCTRVTAPGGSCAAK